MARDRAENLPAQEVLDCTDAYRSQKIHMCRHIMTCIDPSFKASRLSLVDRVFIFAIAHIRGGGEMGRSWYENGKLLKKKNTFTDFITCAEYLIENRYCSKEKLSINGRSAGGLLMGAVLNMRPDLFKAAVAGVPFVDVLTPMLDPTIPLTTSEWEEWGDPRKEEFYYYMKSYSPVDNVLSMSRLDATGAVVPLLTDSQAERCERKCDGKWIT